MHAPKIIVRNLYKIFGTQAKETIELLKQGWTKERILKEKEQLVGINNVSLEINEGEIFVIMGLSGSGKSTLARLINRLYEPSAGEVLIDNRNIFELNTKEIIALRCNVMSMVFQSFALLPNRTTLGNVCFGLEVAKVAKKDREKRAMDALKKMGLTEFSAKYPHELSGGMQQRVGLARALALNPSILIMDEAFSALDPLKRREMQDMLLELQHEQQRTIIFVSHDIEEALRIGSRIAIMQDGCLVQVGTPLELIKKPANEYVRSFFDTVDTTRFIKAIDIAVPLRNHMPLPTDTIMSDTLLSEVIENLVINKRPLLVVDKQQNHYGYISEAEVLSALYGANNDNKI